jgi:valyl-tRNA synthetase
MHPILPFVTEQVWQALNQVAPRRLGARTPDPEQASESVCIAAWPSYSTGWEAPDAEAVVRQWQEKIRAVRNLRAERDLPKDAKLEPILVASGATAEALRRGEPFFLALCPAQSVRIVASAERPPNSAIAVLSDAEVILPLEGLIDKEAERTKHRKTLAELERQIGAVRAKLGNEGFVTRAKPQVVAEQRSKLTELEGQLATTQALLVTLGEGA